VVLFRRTTKGLELTPEGEAGLDALRQGFLQFEEAVRAMQAGQSSKSLTIAAPRDVLHCWLMPRLAEISAADGEMRFMLIAADEELDFTQANLDLAICYAEGPGDHEGVRLAEGMIVTVGLADGAPIGWPGCPAGDKDGGLSVADAGLAIDAAASGFGTAHVPALLAEHDVAEGRVRTHGEPKPTPKSYWLVAPTPQWRQKKVKALVATLTAS
jgi:LysR family glycine cleavage system transcriptional activator